MDNKYLSLHQSFILKLPFIGHCFYLIQILLLLARFNPSHLYFSGEKRRLSIALISLCNKKKQRLFCKTWGLGLILKYFTRPITLDLPSYSQLNLESDERFQDTMWTLVRVNNITDQTIETINLSLSDKNKAFFKSLTALYKKGTIKYVN